MAQSSPGLRYVIYAKWCFGSGQCVCNVVGSVIMTGSRFTLAFGQGKLQVSHFIEHLVLISDNRSVYETSWERHCFPYSESEAFL